MIEESKLHRDALEAQLMASFDEQVGAARNRRPDRARARWVRLSAIAAVLLLCFAASRAPADYGAELGQRIEVRAPPGVELPAGPELGELIESGLRAEARGERQVELRVLKGGPAGTVLQIDVWGAPIEAVAERLRARVPALAQADLTARPIAGRVHTNLAGLLRHRLLHTHDAAAIEAARRELRAALLREGEDGQVDLQVDDAPDGGQRVRVRVEKKQLQP